MLQDSTTHSILIVEPNLDLEKPYIFLDSQTFKITRVSNVFAAGEELQKQVFALVFLSCSFSNKKILNFLEELTLASKKQVLPLILVVDLHQPFSIVPGLHWDQKVAVLSSVTSKEEVMTCLQQLL
jgi:DNA-binding response OmpR family regulator